MSGKRWACNLAMVLNVAALAFYKYTAFLLAAAVAPFFPEAAAAMQPRLDAVLPALPPLGPYVRAPQSGAPCPTAAG